MKKLVVNQKKCNACGMCFSGCDLLSETAEGKAAVVSPGIIAHGQEGDIQDLISLCPAGALAIEENREDKRLAVQRLREELSKPLELELPSYKLFEFKQADYADSLPTIHTSNEGEYIYDDYSEADRKGLSEFKNQIYSQRKEIAQQIIIAYKHEKLLDFIYYEEKKGNFKYELGTALGNRLKNYVAEIEAYSGKKLELDREFFSFALHNDRALRDIEKNDIDNDLAEYVIDKLEYKVSDYAPYINTDDTTVMKRTKHWFSNDEDYDEEEAWCFDLAEASNELNKDILNACSWELQEPVESIILNRILSSDFYQIKKMWKQKAGVLLDALDQLS